MKAAMLALVMAAGLFTPRTYADAKDELARLYSDYNSLKQEFQDMDGKVDAYLTKSRKLRELDKDELDQLISQICRQDVKRDDDEATRLINSMTDKSQANVRREYSNIESEVKDLQDRVSRLVDKMKTLMYSTEPYKSKEEVKSDASNLYSQEENTKEYTSKLWDRLDADYRSLANVKEGELNGSNHPRIRAAMEYGKEKHEYNQRVCDEKEIVLSSGRPDCVTFAKDNCAVWEFKPDSSNYSESIARDQAKDYIPDLQRYFKDKQIAIDNCKHDSNGLPIFEPKGVLYPACRAVDLR